MDSIFDPATSRDAVFIGGKWLPVIAGASDQGEGGDGGTNPDGGDGTGTGNPDGGSGEGGTPEPEGEARTFSQDEVNAIVTREAAKASRGKLDPKELGFNSAKEAKEALERLKTEAEASKDDATKAIEAAKKDAADSARAEILEKANKRLVEAAFKVAAKDAGVVDPDDALVIAQRLEIWTQVEVEDDGDNVKISGFTDDFFKEFKEAKPHLFTQPKTPVGDAGAGAGGGGAKDDKYSPDKLGETYSAIAPIARQLSKQT